MYDRLHYLLLQVRNPGDPMAGHEIECFARRLHCSPEQITPFDLLNACPTANELARVDAVLLGGSGDYSVVDDGPWMRPAMEAMVDLHAVGKPTFASCWGFQAMARALGGEVVTDLSRAEVGTIELRCTAYAKTDPVFGILGNVFRAQMGHQDIVDRIPAGAELLASSDRVENQAFCFPGLPIYCTQFHPELSHTDLLHRLRTYPKYVESIAGMSYDAFTQVHVHPSPACDGLLARFIAHVFGDGCPAS